MDRTGRPSSQVSKKTALRLRRSMTPQEVKVWNWLRERLHPFGWKFRRQVCIGPYVVDFASLRPKLVLEIDGDSHGEDEGRKRDTLRDAFLQSEGFVVLRFWNSEIADGGDVFMDRLQARIAETNLSMTPELRGLETRHDPSPQGKVDGEGKA